MSIGTDGRAMPSRIAEGIVASLRARLRGDLIQPGDPQYDSARRVYNGMIDRYPKLIVRSVDVADVIAVVNFARENRLALAIRGGGHNGPGLGTCDDGMVLDLCRMRGLRVDPGSDTIRVDGGCVWGDVDHATHPFGRAVPCGFISSTGVGGLTLGGGVGYLTRRYGLTIDALLGVDMVLANGQFITANEKDNPDLFWGVRGGGGNFGVVTSFLFKMNPIGIVYGGPIFWPLEKAGDILKFWSEYILEAPEELNGWFAFVTVPPAPQFPREHHLKKMCMICWCYTGDIEKAEQIFATIRRVHRPVLDFAGPIPLPALNSMFDSLYPAGMQWYWKADFFEKIDAQSITIHLNYGPQLPTPFSTMHLYPINGAAHRVDRMDTAWNYRNANFAGVIVGVSPEPENNAAMIRWAKEYWTALHAYSAGGAYLNMVMDEGVDQVKASYGQNYARLTEIKARYDPENLFCINQNIKPAS